LDINDLFLYTKTLPNGIQNPPPSQNHPTVQPQNLLSSILEQVHPQSQSKPNLLNNPQLPPYNNIPAQPRSPPVYSSLNPGINFQYK
jgi:hypothetical protein